MSLIKLHPVRCAEAIGAKAPTNVPDIVELSPKQLRALIDAVEALIKVDNAEARTKYRKVEEISVSVGRNSDESYYISDPLQLKDLDCTKLQAFINLLKNMSHKDHEENVISILRKVLPYRFLPNIPIFNPLSKRFQSTPLLELFTSKGWTENGVVEINGKDAKRVTKNGATYFVKLNQYRQTLYEQNDGNFEYISCLVEKIAELNLGDAKSSQEWNFAFQLDAIGHKDDGTIVIFDAKNVKANEINAEKIKTQCEKHEDAVKQVLSMRDQFKFEHWIILPGGGSGDQVQSFSEIKFFSASELKKELTRFKKIQESTYLTRLAGAVPDPNHGHPSVPDALSYVKYCRECVDESLFDAFSHGDARKTRISGAAGTGKTFLLAYYLYVFSTQKLLHESNKEAPQIKGNILCLTPKDKHRRIIQGIYRRLLDARHPTEAMLRPDFLTLDEYCGESNSSTSEACQSACAAKLNNYNAILIDEAHDIPPQCASAILEWHNVTDTNRHLVVAVDRTQMFGENPWGKWSEWNPVLLKRNYRNPPAIQWASLALLFRWYGDDIEKIIPSKEEMEKQFFVDINETWPVQGGGDFKFEFRQDAHPGSFWDNTVKCFPTAHDAYEWLRPYNLGYEDVLWVRFGPEDSSSTFNYEKPYRFKPHYIPKDPGEAINVINKYIKGQDFPVVVVEGLPDGFTHANFNEWVKARKPFYLVSSRATAFLVFVSKDKEIVRAVNQLAIGKREEFHPAKTLCVKFNAQTEYIKPLKDSGIFNED